MHKTIIFKACTEADDLIVSTFFKKIYREIGWEITPLEELDKPKESFDKRRGQLFVVKVEDQIIGSGGLVPLEDGNAVLLRFFVHPDYRGTGIATKLLELCIAWGKEKQFKEIFLDVRKKNLQAIRFWEKHGFVQFIPRRYDTWTDSFDRLHIRLYYKRSLE